MGKNAKKDTKRQRTKKAAAKSAVVSDLPVKDAAGVKGGRKAGGTQQEYMVMTMENVLVTSVGS
jgi:hypothetical protein